VSDERSLDPGGGKLVSSLTLLPPSSVIKHSNFMIFLSLTVFKDSCDQSPLQLVGIFGAHHYVVS
jgi:hypothetical protein